MAADGPDEHRRRTRRVNGSTRWSADGRNQVLVVTRGHPFDRNSFFDVFEANADIEWSHVEHPAAQTFFEPGLAAPFDCFVLYDMPGIDFRSGGAPDFLCLCGVAGLA